MISSKMLCVNGITQVHQCETTPLPKDFHVLEWLNGQTLLPKVYWKDSNSQEWAGCGSVFNLDEVPHFDPANDSLARLWGGHAFEKSKHAQDSLWASFPYCRFFLPKFSIENGALIAHQINGPVNRQGLENPKAFGKQKKKGFQSHFFPTLDGWTHLIDALIKEIDEGHFAKVVLARHSVHKTTTSLNPFELLANLSVAGSTLFAFQFEQDAVFVGATPEHLYKRKGNIIHVDAIAGTRKRGHSEREDISLEQDLLKDPKEKREFEFVKLSIKESLESICSSFSSQPSNSLIKTPYVQHLYNRFEGILKNRIGDDEIVKALHPTAAIGGYPRPQALSYLIEHEPFNRGWYSSPIGFVSSQEAAFAVAIRSALIQPKTLHTFSGAGIVDGSTAQNEWEELNYKESLWTT